MARVMWDDQKQSCANCAHAIRKHAYTARALCSETHKVHRVSHWCKKFKWKDK